MSVMRTRAICRIGTSIVFTLYDNTVPMIHVLLLSQLFRVIVITLFEVWLSHSTQYGVGFVLYLMYCRNCWFWYVSAEWFSRRHVVAMSRVTHFNFTVLVTVPHSWASTLSVLFETTLLMEDRTTSSVSQKTSRRQRRRIDSRHIDAKKKPLHVPIISHQSQRQL